MVERWHSAEICIKSLCHHLATVYTNDTVKKDEPHIIFKFKQLILNDLIDISLL